MTASDEKLAALEKKMEQLKAQKQKLLAQATALKRKQDTQKKILLGAGLLALLEKGNHYANGVWDLLNTVLSQKDLERLYEAMELEKQVEPEPEPKPEPERWVGSR